MFEGLLQPTHLILILAIALVVFGPGKLPEMGSALGKSIREFRHSMTEVTDAVSGASAEAQKPADPPKVAAGEKKPEA
jgi:sec-independent protein translocase protein TatA